MRRDSTLSFFDQRRPDATEIVMPVVPAAPNRLMIGALCWNSQEGPTSWKKFSTEVVQSTSDNATFFLDASFLHRHEIPLEVFDSLLTRTIVITPLVWGELRDWIAAPFANAHFRDVLVTAKERGNSSIVFLNQDSWPDDIHSAVRYYVSLLSARKCVGIHLKVRRTEQDNRESSDKTLTSILQSRLGDRGAVLAKKGLADHMKPNFAADEDLVVTAVTHAVLTGSETIILTRDRDPLEQFRKFIYLLDTHFRCLLIAEAYADTPENLIEYTSNVEKEIANDCFEGSRRSVLNLPRRFAEWLLREHSSPVTIACHRLAGDDARMKFARLDFRVAREMRRLLEVKGKTGGCNCDFLDGRNCHLAISPPFAHEMCGRALVGYDRHVALGPFAGPSVDLEYALQEVQRFRAVGIDVSLCKDVAGTPGMQLADFYLPMRLSFAAEPQWKSIDWTEFARAIRFFDNAAPFVVDGGVVLGLPEGVRRELISRRFISSTSIRESTLDAEVLQGLTCGERTALEKMLVFDSWGDVPYQYGFGYYLALVALRRQFGKVIRNRVREDHGRECGPGEMEVIACHYGGIRARRLAEHGEVNEHDPLLFAGDKLLVNGMIYAIIEGTDVVFVTHDPLFLYQFAELMSLLASDYVASQYGRRFANDPAAFPETGVQASDESSFMTTFGRAAAGNLPHGWDKEILPRNPYLINFHCWLLGRNDDTSVRLATMTFCGERGMHNLLRVKGSTAGRNVERADGRNVRAALRGSCGEEATVSYWEDRMIRVGSEECPSDSRLDLRISAIAAADISRIHSELWQMDLPWYEKESCVG